MKVLASGKRDSSAVEEDNDTSEGEGRGKRRRKRSTRMATSQQETEETGVGQIGLTGKAMRMRTEKTKRLEEMEKAGENVAGRFVEGKFDEEQMDTDVKQEPVGNLVLEGVSLLELRSFWVQKLTFLSQEVLARIRKLGPGEQSEFHGSMKLGWVQICPFCQQEVRKKSCNNRPRSALYHWSLVSGGNSSGPCKESTPRPRAPTDPNNVPLCGMLSACCGHQEPHQAGSPEDPQLPV